jgi:heptosyltransferase-2
MESPAEPRSIFVLRNNGIGDLLTTTPLFAALRRHFPKSRIVAGVGEWNAAVLENSPDVDLVLPVNAPWHNHAVRPRGLVAALGFVAFSPEARHLARERFDIGIDVLGSVQGSLLMLRAGVPFRLGVKGYAGGHSATQLHVGYNPDGHVARAALRFAELLGVMEIPEPRPRIFLSGEEHEFATAFWKRDGRRVVVAPGGGFARKCWPPAFYAEFLRRMPPADVAVLGGDGDRSVARHLVAAAPSARGMAGRLTLRETFAVISSADAVVCGSSMAMHAAAAFRKPALVLLGEEFSSASRHAAQWGYPETRMLGRDSGHPGLADVDEALVAFADLASS